MFVWWSVRFWVLQLPTPWLPLPLNRLGASLQALADCAYAPSIAFIGFVLFGELLSTWEIIGGIFVLFGVFIGATVTAEIKGQGICG